MRLFPFILISFTFIVSCVKSSIENDIERFTDSRIELMLDSMVIANGVSNAYQHKPYVYISYIDSASCSDCELSHFSDWKMIDHTTDTSKYNHIFIIQPRDVDRERIIEKIRTENHYLQNIYVDTIGVFKRHNPQLPKNKLLHTFMINSTQNVVLIGSPVNNKKIEEILQTILRETFEY